MFKLPTCPHCNSVYYYKDIKKALKQKENTCNHCKKKFFATNKAGKAIIITADIIIILPLDYFLFSIIPNGPLIPVFIITILLISVSFLLFPFTAKFKKSST